MFVRNLAFSKLINEIRMLKQLWLCQQNLKMIRAGCATGLQRYSSLTGNVNAGAK